MLPNDNLKTRCQTTQVPQTNYEGEKVFQTNYEDGEKKQQLYKHLQAYTAKVQMIFFFLNKQNK